MKPTKTPFCLIIAIVTSVIALITPRFLIFFPLLIILIFGIISIVRNEKLKWISILPIVFALFLFSISGDSKVDLGKSDEVEELNSENYIRESIEVTKKNSYTEGDYITVEGRFKNKGLKTLNSITVKVLFLSKNDEILDTERDLIFEEIEPNASKEFKVMHENRKDMKSYRVEFEKIEFKD
jgi:energy-coupling factor transporter transmembrane protein EcfT